MVLGENDSLAQLFPVVDFQAVGHEQVQGLADGILVEYPFVEPGGLDLLRQVTVLISEGGLIFLLFVLWQAVIGDSLLEKLQLALHCEEVHQKAVLHRLGQVVRIGRYAWFQFKNFISVFFNFVLWGGGEAHQGRVKVGEDVPVLVVDGAVGLVADDEIEVAHGEQFPLLILHRVDAVHHGLVSGEHAPGSIVVLLLTQIGDGQVWQQVHKAALGLGNQRVAVRQEEDVFDPAMLQQHFDQGNDCSRLAGAGGHDQQSLPAIPLSKSLAHCLDGSLLVVPPGDLLVHLDVLQAGAHGTQVKELFQVLLGVEGGHLPLRVGPVVYAGVKAIGEEDHRPAAVFLFQQVGVQLGLLAALGRVHTGFLGLDHRQGTVGVVIEHIVSIAHLALVGHAGQLYLIDPVLSLCPAGVGEHGVDVQLPGLVFGQVQGLRHIALPLGRPAGGELGLQRPVLLHQGGQVHLSPGATHSIC